MRKAYTVPAGKLLTLSLKHELKPIDFPDDHAGLPGLVPLRFSRVADGRFFGTAVCRAARPACQDGMKHVLPDACSA